MRLSAPTGYWNATGLIAALGAVWALSLSAADPSRVVRVVAAAAIPPAAAVVYLSASRGAAVAVLIGAATLLVAGGVRRTLLAALAVAPGAVLATGAVASVHGLDAEDPARAALASGHRALLAVLGAALLAAALRAAVLRIDEHPAAWSPRGLASAGTRLAALAAVLVVAGAAGTAVAVHHADRHVASTLAPSARFQDVGTNGRSDLWRVALRDGAREHPLRGTGSGSFARLWAADGTTHFEAVDAHSLPLETLGELGIVGLALLLATLAIPLVALARRAIAGPPAAWGGLLAGTAATLVAAAYDFDWELTALLIPVFAAGGLALAAPEDSDAADDDARVARGLPAPARVALVALAAVAAVGPVVVHRSQSGVDRALHAFRAGDCPAAAAAARDAAGTWSSRPEPYAIRAWCAALAGDPAAVRLSATAIDRDPGDWKLRLSDAIVHARLGRDPRPSFAAALTRAPTSLDLEHARPVLGRAHQAVWWRRGAATIPWPEPRLAGQQLPAASAG